LIRLRPADEVHFLPEIAAQIRVGRISQFSKVILKSCFEQLVEPVAVDDDLASVAPNQRTISTSGRHR
jgi:hypothetical protein